MTCHPQHLNTQSHSVVGRCPNLANAKLLKIATDKVDLNVVADFWIMLESELHSNELAAANGGVALGSSTARILALFLALLFAWFTWIALPSWT